MLRQGCIIPTPFEGPFDPCLLSTILAKVFLREHSWADSSNFKTEVKKF